MQKEALLKLINQAAGSKIEGFAGRFDLGDKYLLAATDGVGTKLTLAKWHVDLSIIGIDLVAMCVNDIVAHGGKPLFFLDYYACGFISESKLEEIIKSIAAGCKIAGCILLGGETAEMPHTYRQGNCDLAGFAVGIVDKDKYLPKENIISGDIILGLGSNGIHSNGFSKIIERTTGYMHVKELMNPTRIYVNSCLSILNQTASIKALAHITGGGLFENIQRVLPSGLTPIITTTSLPILPIFEWVKNAGNFTLEEMLETFNCGIGMAIIVDASKVDEVSKMFEIEGEVVYNIGFIEKT
jgi:phosphoribosylformylglycinamidine cyclo-ligase